MNSRIFTNSSYMSFAIFLVKKFQIHIWAEFPEILKLSFLRKDPKNDNQGEFPDFYKFPLFLFFCDFPGEKFSNLYIG